MKSIVMQAASPPPPPPPVPNPVPPPPQTVPLSTPVSAAVASSPSPLQQGALILSLHLLFNRMFRAEQFCGRQVEQEGTEGVRSENERSLH
jgi:hypothetical protein